MTACMCVCLCLCGCLGGSEREWCCSGSSRGVPDTFTLGSPRCVPRLVLDGAGALGWVLRCVLRCAVPCPALGVMLRPQTACRPCPLPWNNALAGAGAVVCRSISPRLALPPLQPAIQQASANMEIAMGFQVSACLKGPCPTCVPSLPVATCRFLLQLRVPHLLLPRLGCWPLLSRAPLNSQAEQLSGTMPRCRALARSAARVAVWPVHMHGRQVCKYAPRRGLCSPALTLPSPLPHVAVHLRRLNSLGIRGGMLAYVYWQNLRMLYWAPQSRPYHLQVGHMPACGARDSRAAAGPRERMPAGLPAWQRRGSVPQASPISRGSGSLFREPNALPLCSVRNSPWCARPIWCLQAWASLHARARPLLGMAPALQRYLDYAVRWFQAPGQHRA